MSALYTEASKIIESAIKRKGSVRNLIFRCPNSHDSPQNRKSLYALVCGTLKFKNVISRVLKATELSKKIDFFNKWLIYVMIYELLFGTKREINGGGKIKKLILSYSVQLSAALARLKVKEKVKDNDQLLPEHLRKPLCIPKYVRVNTLKADLHLIKHYLEEKLVSKLRLEVRSSPVSSRSFPSPELDSSTKSTFRAHIKETEVENYNSEKSYVKTDPDVPHLLILPFGADLHEDPFLQSGKIIIQDKSSCLPAIVLSPPLHSHVVDCCASPGNKTSQMSALMENTGKIFAFEKDKDRVETLRHQIAIAGCQNVDVFHRDFLLVNPLDICFQNVEYVLLDPSCSGSGIVNRFDYFSDEDDENDYSARKEENLDERLSALSHFQYEILLHALKFPNLKRLVYSTCSVYKQENECIIQKVLNVLGNQFQLVRILPNWKRRGLAIFEEAEYCIRSDPSEDQTNGFFVACFERKVALSSSSPISLSSPVKNSLSNFSSAIACSEERSSFVSSSSKRKKKRKKHCNNKRKAY